MRLTTRVYGIANDLYNEVTPLLAQMATLKSTMKNMYMYIIQYAVHVPINTYNELNQHFQW